MNREYANGVSDTVSFFVGEEVERTPAYGMQTLFVVGLHDSTEIINYAIQHNIQHIYFGANQSFKTQGVSDYETWNRWEEMIKACLKENFWCTLDFDISEVDGVAESLLSEYRRFIPQISIKIPYLSSLGYNATLKIDDIGFDKTNPGVWCINLSDLIQRKYFTNWDEYRKDEIIE